MQTTKVKKRLTTAGTRGINIKYCDLFAFFYESTTVTASSYVNSYVFSLLEIKFDFNNRKCFLCQ